VRIGNQLVLRGSFHQGDESRYQEPFRGRKH
jgi:hypothetical protein